MIHIFLFILVGFSLLSAVAAPPDLTLGEPIDSKLHTTINLGATGLRGWVYYENVYTTESRQIQVREVDALPLKMKPLLLTLLLSKLPILPSFQTS